MTCKFFRNFSRFIKQYLLYQNFERTTVDRDNGDVIKDPRRINNIYYQYILQVDHVLIRA